MSKVLDSYHYLRASKQMPPLGSMGAMLEAMPPTLRTRLLRSVEPHDRALSDTVARLLEKVLARPDAR
jgi:hypothetical protein